MGNAEYMGSDECTTVVRTSRMEAVEASMTWLPTAFSKRSLEEGWEVILVWGEVTTSIWEGEEGRGAPRAFPSNSVKYSFWSDSCLSLSKFSLYLNLVPNLRDTGQSWCRFSTINMTAQR